MLSQVVEVLRKKLGIEGIETVDFLRRYYKIPSTLTIPEGCKKIGHFAFWRCERLKKVSIPGSVVVIDINAFSHCKSIEKIVIPESVKKIGEQAFYGCKKLKKVVIPENVEIGVYAFAGCKYVEEEIRS